MTAFISGPTVTTTTLLNNYTGLVIMVGTKNYLSCYGEEFHPTTVAPTLDWIMETLHYTGHVLTTISAVQNYSSSLEPL